MEAKRIKVLGAVLLAAAFIAGCSHSSSNNNPNPYGWWGNQFGPGGTGFAAGYNSAYSGMAEAASGQASILLNFGALAGGTSAAGASYAGELNVVSPIQCMGNSSIYLPPGVYQLQFVPVAGESFDGSTAMNVGIVATGAGIQAAISIPQMIISNLTPMCGFNGLAGSVDIQNINGYSCISQDMYFTSQMTGYSCQ